MAGFGKISLLCFLKQLTANYLSSFEAFCADVGLLEAVADFNRDLLDIGVEHTVGDPM